MSILNITWRIHCKIINLQYNGVLRDCVEHSLLPLQELPKRYTADKLIKKIERVFGISAADIKTKLLNSGLDYRVSASYEYFWFFIMVNARIVN